jgi:hypothetical protein
VNKGKGMKRWGILGLLILVIGGGYGFLWNKAANRAEELVHKYLEMAQRDPRMKASYKELSTGGFPFSIKVTLEELNFQVDTKREQAKIQFGDEVNFQMKLWDWKTLYVSDEGGSLSVGLTGLPLFKVAWDESEGSMTFDQDQEIQKASGEIEEIKVGDEDEVFVKQVKYEFEDKGLDEKDPTTRAVTFELDVKTGKIMDREIEASLKGEYALPDSWVQGLRSGGQISLEEPDEVMAFLKAAYKNSDVFDIRSLSFEMDGVTLLLQGTLALDEKLQPLASWTFEISGLKSMKEGSPFGAVFFMAPMMGFEISDEGSIKLSGTVQDQEVTVNDQVVAQLPIIDWKEALTLMNSTVPTLPFQGG